MGSFFGEDGELVYVRAPPPSTDPNILMLLFFLKSGKMGKWENGKVGKWEIVLYCADFISRLWEIFLRVAMGPIRI